MPSHRIADAQRPRPIPERVGQTRLTSPDADVRRRQREWVIASLLACPGKDGRVDGRRAA